MNTTLCSLANTALLHITGKDSAQFLQGQITCDIDTLDKQHFLSGAHCTPQGRVIANFYITTIAEDNYLLRTTLDAIALLKESLKKYAVFSAVDIEENNDYCFYGLSNFLGNAYPIGEELTKHSHAMFDDNHLLYLANERIEYWIKKEEAANFLEKLHNDYSKLSEALPQYWDLLDIHNGIANISGNISGEFTPHMLNYHQTGAINFEKGCYTGQEIIARTHYRGEVKQQLQRALINTPDPIEPGTQIFSSDKKSVGALIISAKSNETDSELLAVIKRSALGNELFIETNQTSYLLSIKDLPY